MKSTYLRYLALAKVVQETDKHLIAVDETAKRLLEVIALSHAENRPLTVSEAMALEPIASPGTIHRKLDRLREMGLIDQIFQGDNRRTKYLIPTPVTDRYFDKLGRVLEEATAQA
jgi:DNA-binding MarR family transcriptional regulator